MKLSREILFSAIEKSLLNAEELFTDATILKSNKRFERSYTCFQFCIEEIGKAGLTFQFLLDDDFSKSSQFLKEFRDHKTKTKNAIGIDLIMMKVMESAELKKKILVNSNIQTERIDEINSHKNYSLYTSIINGKVYLPSEIITLKNLEDIEFYAQLRLKIASEFFKAGIQEFDGVLAAKKRINTEEFIEEMAKECRQILYGE